MMQGELPGPVRPCVEQRPIPLFGLTTRVGEHDRTFRVIECVGHRLRHASAEVTSPRKALDLGGEQRVDSDLLRRFTLYDLRPRVWVGTKQRGQRLPEIA